MTCPLSFVNFALLRLSKLDIGAGWYYALVGAVGNTNENQQILAKTANRVVFEIWCHENAKGKWVIDDNGVLFMNEEDAVLFKMAADHS